MESKRLSDQTRYGLIDLGWERPDAPKAKRPKEVAHSKLVTVDDLCESGTLPEIPVEKVA